MSKRLSGQCACGQIRYSVASAPKFSLVCHCRQCQRITGTGHAAQFAVPEDETQLSGELSFYNLTADSGSTVSSGFCINCGNPVLKRTSSMPDMLLFHAATLDDPSVFKPDMVVFEDTAQPWDHVDPNIPRQ